MKFHPSKPLFWVLVLSIIATLPFIGLTDFYSKGEPREAVVALSMFKNGDWILPVNNGGDIPYKPPFFHWCIAICSLLPGYVSEFTARLPSALSLIVLTGISYMFFARRKNGQIALLTAFLLLTAFEVHRAGMACRVDMMLTAFIVGALYLFIFRYAVSFYRLRNLVRSIACLVVYRGLLGGRKQLFRPCDGRELRSFSRANEL